MVLFLKGRLEVISTSTDHSIVSRAMIRKGVIYIAMEFKIEKVFFVKTYANFEFIDLEGKYT